MRALLQVPLAATFVLMTAGAAVADVTRCTDLQGRVVYTDQPCPRGTLQTGAVPVPESAPPGYRPDEGPRRAQVEGAERATQLQRETVDAANRQAQPAPPPQPGQGLTVIGPEPRPTPEEQRGSVRNDGEGLIEFGTAYPGVYPPGVYPPHRPQRPLPDQQPRMRQCDANGCTDTRGNHYNPRGQLDRYTGPGGKTCRPIGTTTVCR